MNPNNIILIIDDNAHIHQDFKNALSYQEDRRLKKILDLEKTIFGENTEIYPSFLDFHLYHAFSSHDALQILQKLQQDNTPVAVAFVDIKMPIGLDGIATSQQILKKFPQTEIVLCTAYSDYSHEDIISKLGVSDHVLFLRKPFDIIEVRQLAIALVQKWNLNKKVEQYTNTLEDKVKKRTIELENALIEVKKANVAKSNFLTLMSHEIRNPINSIVGLMDLITKSKNQKDKEQYIQLTQKASDSLLTLVNDLLDLSKIEANQLHIENTEIDFVDLLENLGSMFKVRVQEKKLEWNLLLPLHLPEKIIGDKMRIKQVLSNYITNAIKFTPKGNITLSIEFSRQNDAQANFLFSVSDTGIGIEKTDLEKLFIDYSQINDGLPYNKVGTGLGLSISKQIAELMGGHVSAKSIKNSGSTFLLHLQMKVSKENLNLGNSLNMENILVYVITKTETTLSFFKYYLKELGYLHNLTIIENENKIPTEIQTNNVTAKNLFVFFEIESLLSQETYNFFLNLSSNVKFYAIASYLYQAKKNTYYSIFTKPLFIKDLLTILSNKPNARNNRKQKIITLTNPQISNQIQNISILLVEDDPTALLITTINLKNFGFKVDTAETCQQVIQLHKKNNYDIIFMDLMLNGCNGIEITEKIRSMTTPLNQVHIIALTANSYSEDKERCLQAGMNDFLTKPATSALLYEKITNHLSAKTAPITETSTDNKNSNNIIQTIKSHLQNNYHFNEEQIQRVLQTTKIALKKTFEEMEQALQSENLALVKILFHRLKGALKNIGLSEAADWAREIEISNEDNLFIQAAEAAKQHLQTYLNSIQK